MRQELESNTRKPGEREGGGLGGWGRQTQSLGDNTALEEEMNVLWEDTWRRGRLDIAGTKQVARLFEIGGPQWFVTVLVEKMVSQVYNEDVERATEMVFSLLHIDLVCCTLARLTVQCLAASLAMRGSRPYSRAREGRGAELA